jgi:hypothetical protein
VHSSPHLFSSAPSALPLFECAFEPSIIQSNAFPNPTSFRERLRALTSFSSAHSSPHLFSSSPSSPHLLFECSFEPPYWGQCIFKPYHVIPVRLSFSWVGYPLQWDPSFFYLGRSPIAMRPFLHFFSWVGHPLQWDPFFIFFSSGRSPITMRQFQKKNLPSYLSSSSMSLGTMRPLASFLVFYHWADRLEKWDNSRNLFRFLFFIE